VPPGARRVGGSVAAESTKTRSPAAPLALLNRDHNRRTVVGRVGKDFRPGWASGMLHSTQPPGRESESPFTCRSVVVRTFVLGIVYVLLASVPRMEAQVVTGRVTGSGDQPVVGAFVRLIHEQGTPRAPALADPGGEFHLRAPGPGIYRVLAEMIGYRTTLSSALELPTGGTTAPQLTRVEEPVPIEGLEVLSGGRRCVTRPADGDQTSRLWEEARKALTIAGWAVEARLFRFELALYDRDLSRDLREVEREVRVTRVVGGGPPCATGSPDELQTRGFVRVTRGFVRVTRDSIVYHAPDADVLLSDGFLDGHCVGVRTTDLPEAGCIGLTFSPGTGRNHRGRGRRALAGPRHGGAQAPGLPLREPPAACSRRGCGREARVRAVAIGCLDCPTPVDPDARRGAGEPEPRTGSSACASAGVRSPYLRFDAFPGLVRRNAPRRQPGEYTIFRLHSGRIQVIRRAGPFRDRDCAPGGAESCASGRNNPALAERTAHHRPSPGSSVLAGRRRRKSFGSLPEPRARSDRMRRAQACRGKRTCIDVLSPLCKCSRSYGPLAETQSAALARIKRNQEHLLALIQDILPFATLESGKIEMRAADVKVTKVLADAEAMILPQVQAKGIAYRGIPCDRETRVRGDHERIVQILLTWLATR
jgi:hypothetical protein